MTAPFRSGDPAVMVSLDPEGLRVSQTAVIAVRPAGDGWYVETLAGHVWLNQDGVTQERPGSGEGVQAELLPLDPEMAREFVDKGSSFVVRASTSEVGQEQDEQPAYDWQRYEPEVSQQYDQDRGQER